LPHRLRSEQFAGAMNQIHYRMAYIDGQ